MNKKKIGLVAILLFLFLGLGSFVFANPDNEAKFDSEEPKQGEEASSKSEKSTDEEENTSDETSLSTEELSTDDNQAATTRSAARKAQNSTSASNNSANSANNGSTTTTDYYSQASALVAKLEAMVSDSTNRDGILETIDFRDKNQVEKLVNSLSTSANKNDLVSRLEAVNQILNDNEDPVITGIKDGSITSENVNLTITDSNDVTYKVTKDGKEVEYTAVFTQTGTYVVTATDAAFNTTTLTFTIDKEAPIVKSLGITDIDEYKDETGKLYIKNGGTVRVLLYFEEKLGTEPTVKLGGKEVKATYREASSHPEDNSYAYYADIKITDDMNLKDGIIPFEVYGYADTLGNEGKLLTEADVNSKTYPSVTLDNTKPVLNFNNGFIASAFTVKVTDDNFDYMEIKYVDGRKPQTIKEPTFELEKTGDNTRYNITVYDKAGNVSDYRDIYLDNVKPVVDGKAIRGGKEVSLENNGVYQKVTLNISDGSMKTVSLVKADGSEEVLATYKDNYTADKMKFEKTFDQDGTYTVKAVDRNKNESTITFTVDTKKPVLNAANILVDGDVNEQKYFYAKVGDTIFSYVRFNEQLKELPTFTLINNGKKYEVKDVQEVAYKDGQYGYQIRYQIDENTEMSDGEIEMLVTNIQDKAGNKYDDITKPTNGHIVYLDMTAPEVTKVQIINNSNPNSEYVKNGETIRVRATFNEKLSVAPVLTIGNYTATFKNVGDGKGNDLWSADITIDADEAELKEGKIAFTITGYQDLAGNEGAKVTESAVKSNITYDRTAPSKVSLRINSSYKENKEYGKVGDSFGVYLVVDEKLAKEPTFTVNGKEYKANQNKKVNSGYMYAVVYPITADMKEGLVEFTISNIVDKAGNKLADLTNADTNEKLVIDKTASTIEIGGTTGSKYWKKEQNVPVKITETNLDSVYYIVNSSRSDNSIYDVDSDKAIKVSKEDLIDNGDGTYTFYVKLDKEGRFVINVKAIDKAGNVTYHRDGWYQIDRTNPEIDLHKNKNEATIEPGLHNYSVSATVDESHLESLKLNGQDYEAGSTINDEGSYTLVATDKAGNVDQIDFEIDKTDPVISINGVNYSGLNENMFFLNKVEDFKITDKNGYTVRELTRDGQKVELNEDTFSVDGVYKLHIKDNALNDTTIEFTLDTNPVGFVDIRVNSTNKLDKSLAKKGDTIGVYLNVDEELKELPTIVINGKEYRVYDQSSVGSKNHTYVAFLKVTDDTKEGIVEFTISNIIDKAGNPLHDKEGNVLTTLTNANTTQKVIVDKTAPVRKSLGIYGGNKYNGVMYVKKGDRIYVNVQFDEKLAVSPYVKVNGKEAFQYGEPKEMTASNGEKYYIYSKVYKVDNEEGPLSFEIYGYSDAAGNEGKALTAADTTIGSQNGNIVVDNTAPSIGNLESEKTYHSSIPYEMSDNSGSFKLYYDLGHNYQTCEELIEKGSTMGTISDSYKGNYPVPGDYDGVSVCLVDAAGNTTFRNNISIRVK